MLKVIKAAIRIKHPRSLSFKFSRNSVEKGNLNKTYLQVALLNLNTIGVQFALNHVLYQCKSIVIKQFAGSLVEVILFVILRMKKQNGELLQ